MIERKASTLLHTYTHSPVSYILSLIQDFNFAVTHEARNDPLQDRAFSQCTAHVTSLRAAKGYGITNERNSYFEKGSKQFLAWDHETVATFPLYQA